MFILSFLHIQQFFLCELITQTDRNELEMSLRNMSHSTEKASAGSPNKVFLLPGLLFHILGNAFCFWLLIIILYLCYCSMLISCIRNCLFDNLFYLSFLCRRWAPLIFLAEKCYSNLCKSWRNLWRKHVEREIKQRRN